MRSVIRLGLVATIAVSAWFGAVATAHASICTSITDKQKTTGTVCITNVVLPDGTSVNPTAGNPITINGTTNGNTKITATVMYNPTALPPGEVRGCAGERLTPSGCLSWLWQGNYALTQLYSTSGTTGDRTYTWTWATSQYNNTSGTLDAQIQLDGNPAQAALKVNINNQHPGSFPSPIANGGKLPIFSSDTTYPFTIAAFGDGPSGSPQTTNVANLVHSWNPDMYMYLGDVYQRGMKDEFMNFYNPLYGGDYKKTITTVGNHEYKQLTDAAGYFWYWNFPDNGSSPAPPGGKPGGGTAGGSWYSLDVGGPSGTAWHIISLNSNVPMTLSPATPQGSWLQKDLAADLALRPKSTHPCSLAFWHAARFSDISLRLPSTSTFWNQLYPYGDDLIINAHSHVYERWQPLNNSGQVVPQSQGITEFVVGTGGNVLAQQWNTNDSRSAIRENTSWGALKLELYATYAKYTFYEVNGSNPANAKPFDTGTVTCR